MCNGEQEHLNANQNVLILMGSNGCGVFFAWLCKGNYRDRYRQTLPEREKNNPLDRQEFWPWSYPSEVFSNSMVKLDQTSKCKENCLRETRSDTSRVCRGEKNPSTVEHT
jgi:hypothetical protein